MIKPARANRDIALGRDPMSAASLAGVEARDGPAQIPAFQVQRGPAGIACNPFLVSNPAEVRTDIAKHSRAGLQLPHDPPRVLPIVVRPAINTAHFARPTVVTVTPVGSVEPDREQFAIICEQFPQLVAVISDVFRPAVVFVVAVPG